MPLSDYQSQEPKRAEVDQLAGATLLEFGNPWCGHCRRVEPLLANALERHPSVRHIRIADASGRRLGRSFHVKLWPTLIFIKDGEEIGRSVRPTDAAKIYDGLAAIE